MQHWSGVSARDMLRQNRSVCWWGAVTERRRKKPTITLKECHVWEKLVKCGFICLSLETLLVPLTAFWCCHFSVFDVGRIRAMPEWSSASLTSLVSNLEFLRTQCCSKCVACIFCCKWGSQTFCILYIKMQPFQCSITCIWSSRKIFQNLCFNAKPLC